MLNRRLSVAPMMEYTDRHCRYLLRLISRHTLLYTEMVTGSAVIHGDRRYLLGYNAMEHPLALQLGGSDPQELAEAAAIAEQWGYDEVNLNVGCPSNKVQNGAIGACLMAQPQQVIAREFIKRDEIVRVLFDAVFEKANRLFASIRAGRNRTGGRDGY